MPMVLPTARCPPENVSVWAGQLRLARFVLPLCTSSAGPHDAIARLHTRGSVSVCAAPRVLVRVRSRRFVTNIHGKAVRPEAGSILLLRYPFGV